MVLLNRSFSATNIFFHHDLYYTACNVFVLLEYSFFQPSRIDITKRKWGFKNVIVLEIDDT